MLDNTILHHRQKIVLSKIDRYSKNTKYMLYKLAHFLRDQMPWVWDFVEVINSLLFRIRYGGKLRCVENEICHMGSHSSFCHEGYDVVPIREITTESLVEFFANQPAEAFTFFKPHKFDSKSINKLQKNWAFIGYVMRDAENGKIAGYCFNLSFFHGKGFRGRMVDVNYRGRGLGTMMNRLLNKVGFGICLRLFETVSKDNIALYGSAISASAFKVIKELPHNELYLEIINDMKQSSEIPGNMTGGGKSQVIVFRPLFNVAMQERRAA